MQLARHQYILDIPISLLYDLVQTSSLHQNVCTWKTQAAGLQLYAGMSDLWLFGALTQKHGLSSKDTE